MPPRAAMRETPRRPCWHVVMAVRIANGLPCSAHLGKSALRRQVQAPRNPQKPWGVSHRGIGSHRPGDTLMGVTRPWCTQAGAEGIYSSSPVVRCWGEPLMSIRFGIILTLTLVCLAPEMGLPVVYSGVK
jgi:hypothetical protein